MNNKYYQNPFGITNIGDPYVLRASDNKYYCYPTTPSVDTPGFKVWSSEDLVNWRYEGIALTIDSESWGYKDLWAPEVIEFNGKYMMYFTARWKKNNSLRIGVAVSDSPTGPFKDVHDGPMFDFEYAAIDGNILVDDDGRKYMYYSRDCSENVINGLKESHLYVVELNDYMVSVKGEPQFIMKPEQDWELMPGPNCIWNEGPAIIKRNETYYMMYSANFYQSKYYGLGYATATNPWGPFTKYELNPVTSTAEDMRPISGPGHNSICYSPDGNEMFLVYHTHTDPVKGGGDRQVCIDRMGFRHDGTLYTNAPTITPQPMPSGVNGYYNIAPLAKTIVTGTKEGYRFEALFDGEIGMYERFENYEWAAEGNADIQMKWDKPYEIESIWIYGSSLVERNNAAWDIEMSDGQRFESIKLPAEKGCAYYMQMKNSSLEWIKVSTTQQEGLVGISEIIIIGR